MCNDPIDLLTAREQEILAIMATGLVNKLIAARLSIAEQTVKNHTKSIFRKLQVTNRVEAALLYQKHRYNRDEGGSWP